MFDCYKHLSGCRPAGSSIVHQERRRLNTHLTAGPKHLYEDCSFAWPQCHSEKLLLHLRNRIPYSSQHPLSAGLVCHTIAIFSVMLVHPSARLDASKSEKASGINLMFESIISNIP